MSDANRSPLHERIALMVEYALPGTLIPVDSLRELLDVEEGTDTDPGLSLDEVARRCAALGGKGVPVQTATVRKWIRTGLAGEKLSAFAWGRTYRVRKSALAAFLDAVQGSEPRVPGVRAGDTGQSIDNATKSSAPNITAPDPNQSLAAFQDGDIQGDIAASRRRVTRHSRRAPDRRTAA